MTTPQDPATYEGQLAERAAEMLPGIGTDERLELLGVMDPDDLRASLAFIAAAYPLVFDFALVRDRQLVERLNVRRDEDQEAEYLAEPEGYCTACGENVAWFFGREGPQHFRGPHKLITGAEHRELFTPADGHEPVIAWRAPAEASGASGDIVRGDR